MVTEMQNLKNAECLKKMSLHKITSLALGAMRCIDKGAWPGIAAIPTRLNSPKDCRRFVPFVVGRRHYGGG